jgi:hypothetical protein
MNRSRGSAQAAIKRLSEAEERKNLAKQAMAAATTEKARAEAKLRLQNAETLRARSLRRLQVLKEEGDPVAVDFITTLEAAAKLPAG